MKIIPAIDLIDNQCVRLTKGDYNTKTVFDSDPLKVANEFISSGVSLIHVVDLDGAKAGKIINIDTIKKLIKIQLNESKVFIPKRLHGRPLCQRV